MQFQKFKLEGVSNDYRFFHLCVNDIYEFISVCVFQMFLLHVVVE